MNRINRIIKLPFPEGMDTQNPVYPVYPVKEKT
jgi:hypothetical protein